MNQYLSKSEKSLFLVILGGNIRACNIELHDVRWVIGEKIEDTFKQLRNEWFGEKKGLHIDSYIKIRFVDGYKVSITRKSSLSSKINKQNNMLWFVNLGGYNKNELAEQHSFRLVVAKTSKEAITKAKYQWENNKLNKIHKDNLTKLRRIIGIDNCHSIKVNGDWEIELTEDKEKRCQLFVPDWYGYMRIDK
ncbi:DUF1543 domain-containing protein [Prochlorococcus sp. MIT 1223]|uniref:DUF1543 domain-containing protein n=1 Tax=Prochlorococcus sp. MIT 1223 TaxID=3096217 RepID=UPI002A765943|nr:DUF1543 domain-containing protein [Prochlorococcus sp. MIT 1223]